MNIEHVVIGALLVFIFMQDYFNRKERDKLTSKLLAKTFDDVVQLDRKPEKSKAPDVDIPYDPIEDLPDKDFDELIRDSIGELTLREKAKRKLEDITNAREN